MSDFAAELLTTLWPVIWSAILGMIALLLGVVQWYLRSQSSRLDSITSTLAAFKDDIARIETDMVAWRAEERHRRDRLIHATDRRVGEIETICRLQHGGMLNRRSTDVPGPNWQQDSDVAGGSLREESQGEKVKRGI